MYLRRSWVAVGLKSVSDGPDKNGPVHPWSLSRVIECCGVVLANFFPTGDRYGSFCRVIDGCWVVKANISL